MAFTPLPLANYDFMANFNPVQTGINTAASLQDMQKNNLLNAAQSIQNQYLQPQLAQTLLQMQLANQKSQATLPYAAPQAAADLAQTQAQVPYIGSETKKNLASIPLLQAQALHERVMANNPLLGLTGAAGQIGGLLWMQNHGLGGSQGSSQVNPQSVGQQGTSGMSQGQSLQGSQFPTIAGSSGTNGPTGYQGSTPVQSPYNQAPVSQDLANSLRASIFSGLAKDTAYSIRALSQTPSGLSLIANNPEMARQVAEATKNTLSYLPGAAETIAQIASNPTTQNMIQQVQDANGSKLQKDTVTAQIIGQRYYANSVHQMLQSVAPDMPQIAQFAGLAGKAKQNADMYAASTNQQSSDAYIKFNDFVNSKGPIIANDMRRALGGQATDKEAAVMDNLIQPIYWKNNPSLALSQFQSLIDMMGINEKAIMQNPSQVTKQLISNSNNRIKVPGAPNLINSLQSAQKSQAQSVAPKGYINVKDPNGNEGYLPAANRSAAIKAGYVVLQ